MRSDRIRLIANSVIYVYTRLSKLLIAVTNISTYKTEMVMWIRIVRHTNYLLFLATTLVKIWNHAVLHAQYSCLAVVYKIIYI